MPGNRETDEQYKRRMMREFWIRFWLTFGISAAGILLLTFIATRKP